MTTRPRFAIALTLLLSATAASAAGLSLPGFGSATPPKAHPAVEALRGLTAVLHTGRPRVLALGLLWFLIVIGLYGMGFWLPQVIQSYGLDDLSIGFITAIPYVFAAVLMVLWGRRSDRKGERRRHISLPLLMAAFAFARWRCSRGSP